MKSETFSQMLKNVLFPSFQFTSVTFLLLVMHTVFFFLCLLYSKFNSPDTSIYIMQKSLLLFGEKYPYFIIKEQEYWRLLSTGLLSASFLHYFTIIITLLTIGSYLEKLLGSFHYFLLFLYINIMTSILTSIVQDSPSIGGSLFSIGMVGFISFQGVYFQRQEQLGLIRENDWVEILDFPKKCTKEYQFLINMLCVAHFLVGLSYRNVVDTLGNALAIVNGIYFGWVMIEDGKRGWILFKNMITGFFLVGAFVGMVFRNPEMF